MRPVRGACLGETPESVGWRKPSFTLQIRESLCVPERPPIGVGRLDTSPALDAAAAFVSVLVSFVVVRLGSTTAAGGLVEYEADADDRA